jgi:hypothetical protein
MKFKGKYDTLIETAITRFEMGGIMSGDLVKFRKDALKHEKIKNGTEQYKETIKAMMDSDLNIRVSAVKSIRPTTTGNYEGGYGAGTRSPTDHFVDISLEYAPGLVRDPITVPIEVLDLVDMDGNLAPVPDSLKREGENTKPKDVKSSDDNRKNPDKNTKPEFEAKTVDGRSQTKKPNEVKKKNQGKLTLEDVYQGMMEQTPERFVTYEIEFGTENPDLLPEIADKIKTLEGFSDNMNAKIEGNTITIIVDGEIDTNNLETTLSPMIDGTVAVNKVENGIENQDAEGTKRWMIKGKNHLEGSPAITIDDAKTKGNNPWKIKGKNHREGSPAITIDDADMTSF